MQYFFFLIFSNDVGICYARLSVHIYHLVIIFLSSILSLLFPLAFIPSKQAHSPSYKFRGDRAVSFVRAFAPSVAFNSFVHYYLSWELSAALFQFY